MIRRPYRHSRSRSHLTPPQSSILPAVSATLTDPGGILLITCDSPVVVNGLPTGITRQAAGAGAQLLPLNFTQPTPTTLQLGYAGSLTTTDKVTIPANVPQVRGQAGGGLASQLKTF
jgi:hypothetical protein